MKGKEFMMRSLAAVTLFVCSAGCALTSAVLGQTGAIRVIYYAPAWGANTNGEEVVYFLKQVTLEAPRNRENRIYLCSIKPDGTERKEIAELWKENRDQWFEPSATAIQMEINTASKQAAIGVEFGKRGGVFVVNLDGKDLRPVWPKEWKENRPTRASHPTWSPDGQWLAFQEFRRGDGESRRIVKCQPDGTGYLPLTDSSEGGWHPAWSPEADVIAYIQYRKFHLWLMKSDGTEKRNTKQWGRYPRWSPDGKSILLEGSWLIDSSTGSKIRNWIPPGIYPKWGTYGFVSVGPLDISVASNKDEATRQLLRNVSRRGEMSDMEKEESRW
jgi:hypothetical protein